MKKHARDLKKGDKILMGEQKCEIISIEISEAGKQGKRKVRIEALTESKETLVVIRPDDYPVEVV